MKTLREIIFELFRKGSIENKEYKYPQAKKVIKPIFVRTKVPREYQRSKF